MRARQFLVTLSFLLLFFLISCAPPLRTTSTDEAILGLQKSIDAILADSIFVGTQVGVKIVSVTDGRVHYERESKLLFHPASNLKLFTTATALHVLGADHKFRTAVYADSIDERGTIIGNLYIKGFGNPDLTLKDLRGLVEQLKDKGVKSVKGDVVGDASYFDELFWGSGWMWDDEPSIDEPYISPLTINDNSVRVQVSPGGGIGKPVVVQLEPQTKFLSVVNEALTGSHTSQNTLEVTRDLKERSNTIRIRGVLPIMAGRREFLLSVWKPELYTVTLLSEELGRQGIVVTGQPQLGRVSEHAKEFILHEWPIDSVMININKTSDNLSAENTLKVIGAMKRGVPGTARDGISVAKEFLLSFGIDSTSYLMVDGSGVSRYNLVSADVLVTLLAELYKHPEYFNLLYKSLPIAGVDGTLKDRMRGSIAAGNARAKTGTLRGVSSLCGYVRTSDGDLLAFSILMQNFIGSPKPFRDAQDKIVDLLARFSRPAARRF